MGEFVQSEISDDGIVRILLNGPPETVLTQPQRAALAAAFKRAAALPAARAVVLLVGRRDLAPGFGLARPEEMAEAPSLAGLANRIEDMPVPVIIALSGSALSAGLELALAAHYRLAGSDSYFAAPEIRLGLMPQAGGTIRLARLIGPSAALQMMLGGQAIGAAEALRLGLVDRLAEGHIDDAAMVFARHLIDQGGGPRPTLQRNEWLRDGAAYQRAVAQQRDRLSAHATVAPRHIVDCVEAAQLLTPAAALEFEATAFADCLASDASIALRYLTRAEQRLARAHTSRPMAHLAVDGVDARWVRAGLDIGATVALAAPDPLLAAATGEEVIAGYDKAVAGRALSPEQRDMRLARLDIETGVAGLARADLVLAGDVVWTQAAEHRARGAAFAVVAQMATPDILAPALPPEAVILLEGGDPAGRLTEVLTGPQTPPAALGLITDFLRRARRVPVVSEAADGGIGSAIWGALGWVIRDLVAQGCNPDMIESVLKGHGMSRAPIAAFLSEPAAAQGRGFSTEDIWLRCVAGMANAGALLVEAGIARHPSDIDLVLVHGYGFPAWLGGPMLMADQIGLLRLRNTLRAFSDENPEFWTPSQLFDDLIKNGRKFGDLDPR